MPQNRQECLWRLKDNKKGSWGFIFFLPHEPNKTIQLYIISHIIFNYPKINTQVKNIVQIPITAN